jgi:hypothetical protein
LHHLRVLETQGVQVYAVTALVNSMFGLLVFPQQKYVNSKKLIGDSMPYHIDHYRVKRTTYCRLPTPNTGTSSFGLARFARKDGPDFARSSTQLRALAYPQVTVGGLLRYHHQAAA